MRNSCDLLSGLLSFVSQQYGIEAIRITPAKRGFFGETWRIDSNDRSYFIKLVYSLAHQQKYERSFAVLQHLNNHGIDFVSRIVKTADGKLFEWFNSAIMGVFDWIGGENTETDETKVPEFNMLARIYAVPFHELNIKTEDFSEKITDVFFEQWSGLDNESAQ